MTGEVVVLASLRDAASINIARRLLEMESWEEMGSYSAFKDFRLVFIREELIVQKGLLSRLEAMGLHPDLVVFASRHVSKEGVAWLGGHFTGTVDGGCQLSRAAPSALKSLIQNLSAEAPPDFRVSAEATHHGPVDMTVPSVFAEIGSTEKEWSDPQAGTAVARAILNLSRHQSPTFLGFGGGHYVMRQTALLLETGASFGHLFSNYQLGSLDRECIQDAAEKSNASYAYFDRKSMRSPDKKRIAQILSDLDIELLREREISSRFPGPLDS